MAVLRWQWTLANRGQVMATIESGAAGATEAVLQDGRVLSQCARGAKPDGHVVSVSPVVDEDDADASVRPPIEAVVTFAPNAAICILRVADEEVSPAVWPGRDKNPAAGSGIEKPSRPFPWRALGIGVGVGLLVFAGVSTYRSQRTPPAEAAGPDVSHRAGNGLFIAHHPTRLEPRQSVLPAGTGGLVLEDRGKAMSIVYVATRLDPSASRDPWSLQQRFHAEALANLGKGALTYEESARRDDKCLGRPGAVTTGALSLRDMKIARVWACALIDDDAGYLILTALSEPASKPDEHLLRSVVDATELTHLAEAAPTTGVDPSLIPLPSGSTH